MGTGRAIAFKFLGQLWSAPGIILGAKNFGVGVGSGPKILHFLFPAAQT